MVSASGGGAERVEAAVPGVAPMHADAAQHLLGRRIFNKARAGTALRLAIIFAVMLHLGLGALFVARPPTFLAALRHKPQPPRETEIELVQNNMATAGDGPVGGDHGASAAPKATTPSPPRQQTQPTPPAPAGPGEIAAAPPPQPTPPQPTEQLQMNLTGSDSDQGVSGGSADTPAAVDPKAHNKLPAYPTRAGVLGEHGTVTALITITADGHAGSVVVVKTSGWPALDTAAVQAWQTWRFKPAVVDGAPAVSQQVVSIGFTLNQP